MSVIEGKIEAISAKDRNTSRGVAKAYSLKVGDKWVNCGFKNPNVERGEYVQLEVENTQWGLQLKKNSSVTKSGGAPDSTGSVAMNKRVDFPVPLDDRGMTIARQNALTNAVKFHAAHAEAGKDGMASVDAVIETASYMANWTTGHTETEEAERIMQEMYGIGVDGDDE